MAETMLQEKVLGQIKAKAAEKNYLDELYYQKVMEVYKVSFTNKTSLYVSMGIGEQLQQAMLAENSPKFVKLGNGVWRMYEFKSIVPAQVRFCELCEWTKSKVLKENPKLFDDWYRDFSPRMKKMVDRLKEWTDLDSNLRIKSEG